MTLSNDENMTQYRLGMTGDVEFALINTKGTLVIPSSYITTENEEKFVYKLKNGNKVKTKIKTGEIIDSKTEITSGLKEGDIIYD
jgi:hypothetical protein